MIIGAGFAGLITAHILKREQLFEAAAEPVQSHNALLRFRSDVVSRVTGIEFRKVKVRKGIFYQGAFMEPNIHIANAYSLKCLGITLGERSIWDLTPVDRYIAPENFYQQLIESLGNRISWGSGIKFSQDMAKKEPIISTAPLHIPTTALGMPTEGIEFKHAQIKVLRFRIPKCDVHQTIYFPSPQHSLYRASITGDMLICEFSGTNTGDWQADLAAAFCLHTDSELQPLIERTQRYGKIAPINEEARKNLVHDLTANYGIFSIGRFATWRNILLDDIVQDAELVKKLISATNYERRLQAYN